MTKAMSRREFLAVSMTSLGALALTGNAIAQGQEAPGNSLSPEQSSIDYMVLVNKQHKLPDDWEDKVEIVSFTNSEDWDVDVEVKAYEAYLKLKEDLEADGVYIDLDSAYRSVAKQQRVWDDFTVKYGEEYVKQYVAVPGFSEHHTGLALDLFLIIDGNGVYENEDMVTYPEIWEKIHAKIADYGFILRYLPRKKIETGYSCEPWHIRYLDNPAVAREIMDAGITFEKYLGELDPMIADCDVDYGDSDIYTDADIDSALNVLMAQFKTWKGCVMKHIAFAGDKACEDDLSYVNELRKKDTPEFTQALVLSSNFHSPSEEDAKETAWNPDTDYNGWTWHFGRTSADSAWQLLSWGFA
ncbi:MAG: M15 family metallopeptidase [Coriobacteriales bacterium]|nr:M15 family metallopeptidase [Coriobacteriales bacterium]